VWKRSGILSMKTWSISELWNLLFDIEKVMVEERFILKNG